MKSIVSRKVTFTGDFLLFSKASVETSLEIFSSAGPALDSFLTPVTACSALGTVREERRGQGTF